MKDAAAARLSILDIVLITVDIERGGTMRRWVLFLLLFVPATWAFGLDLGLGDASFTAYTCDLSFEYVKINASYRS